MNGVKAIAKLKCPCCDAPLRFEKRYFVINEDLEDLHRCATMGQKEILKRRKGTWGKKRKVK